MFKHIPKAFVALLLAASLALGICSSAQAAGWKTASKTQHYYSWTGIHVASLGVQGDYYTNGKKITNFAGVRAYPNVYVPLASYSDVKQGWKHKTNTSGVAFAEATYKLGIKTQWIEITVQSFRDSVSATAKK